MKLSVVIVNYNVKHFLEQCLFSVMKSAQGIEAEIFVVDNNSVDGSCNMVREKFPRVKLIENKKNTGFSYANNQAILESKGEYILLLNPDTVIEESTLSKVLNFMDSHPDAGGLGVKMIDGKGHFLPESKRGLPTPMVAFYKIFGLSKLFPKSKTFGRYHLGYLNKDEVNEIDVLAGAFMLLRKKTLEVTGLLDESFFMYGEDIDLSYRITRTGFKNYYFPDTAIIHYKGESTKKSSINYVLVFYKAMIIFAEKHFSARNARIFSALINLAVYFRAFLAISSRFFKAAIVPAIDAGLIYSGFYVLKPIWENYKFSGQGYYPPEYLKFVVPAYVIAWITSIFFSGGYDKPVKLIKITRGIIAGTLVILIFYSLLSEEFRFSRALILIGSAWTFTTIISFRIALHLLKINNFDLKTSRKKRVVIVGNKNEVERISGILSQTDVKPVVAGAVSPEPEPHGTYFIGDLRQIGEIIKINNIDEIIYSAKDVSSQAIIRNMLDLSSSVDYKIASPDSISVIGSNSIDTAGDLYTVNLNTITKKENKRNKRLLDVVLSLIFLASSPVLLLISRKKSGIFHNIFSVLFGFSTWVGYSTGNGASTHGLPRIRKGIFGPVHLKTQTGISKEGTEKINMEYAKDYSVRNDLSIIYKNLKNIGLYHDNFP